MVKFLGKIGQIDSQNLGNFSQIQIVSTLSTYTLSYYYYFLWTYVNSKSFKIYLMMN